MKQEDALDMNKGGYWVFCQVFPSQFFSAPKSATTRRFQYCQMAAKKY
jgi:hypothetical protein